MIGKSWLYTVWTEPPGSEFLLAGKVQTRPYDIDLARLLAATLNKKQEPCQGFERLSASIPAVAYSRSSPSELFPVNLGKGRVAHVGCVKKKKKIACPGIKS